jgi:hypothetical protein
MSARASTVAHAAWSTEPRAQDSDKLARLGRAVMALSRELAASRREVISLKRENSDLRARVAELERASGADR